MCVCGVVKPGSNTDSLIGTVKGEVGKITMNEFLIICSRTNDIDRNHRNAFKNMTDFITNVNHTNIILTGIPYRYDVTGDSHVNSKIRAPNSKLQKLAKICNHVNIIEPANSRFLYTRHDLHLNKCGKELLSNQLALHLF